ncbi:MAG: hypothetical protein AB1697_11150 [Pseudomonadota bacterium]
MKDISAELWKLQNGVELKPEVAADVAKIACALKSLSIYASMAFGDEAVPDDLQKLVDEGMQAMARIFVV